MTLQLISTAATFFQQKERIVIHIKILISDRELCT